MSKKRKKQLALPASMPAKKSIPALPTPKMYISEDVKLTLAELVKRPLEWCLHAKTEFYRDGVRLVDFIVPEQNNGGAHSDVTGAALIDVTDELAARGEAVEKWNCTIHSHNTMGAFFSGGDQTRMDEWAIYGVPLFFSIVVSSQGGKLNLLCWANFYKPLRVDIETTVVYESTTVREVSEGLAEIADLEARLAGLKEAYKEACSGWATELSESIEAKTIKTEYGKYDSGKYDSGKYDYGKYYDDDFPEDDFSTPMFTKNGLICNAWVKGWMRFNEWSLENWEKDQELVDKYKPKNKAERRFLAFLYATPMILSDLDRLIAYLRTADNPKWDDFILKFMEANPDHENKFTEFWDNPFTS